MQTTYVMAANAHLLGPCTTPGQYTFVQKRGCCREVKMIVHVRDGHLTHEVTARPGCCLPCQERRTRESGVNDVVTVDTFAASQCCRVFRIVLGMLVFLALIGMATTMLCFIRYQGDASSGSSKANQYGSYYTPPSSYYTPPSSYYTPSYHNYYGVEGSVAWPVASIMLIVAPLAIVVSVASWVACCLRLHHVTVVLKGTRHAMGLWLPPAEAAELATVIKAARAAYSHTRLGAELDSIVTTAAETTSNMRNRFVVAEPLLRQVLVQQQLPAAATTTTATTYEMLDPARASFAK